MTSYRVIRITLPVQVSEHVSFLLSHEYHVYDDEDHEYITQAITAAKSFGCDVKTIKVIQEEV
jgi:hypothetical protein